MATKNEMRRKARADALQRTLDDVVIVAVAGIDGDCRRLPVGQRGKRVALRAVIEAEQDDGVDARPQHAGIAAALRGIGQPVHRAVMAGLQKGLEIGWRGLNGVGTGDADDIEAFCLCQVTKQRRGAIAGQKSRSG